VYFIYLKLLKKVGEFQQLKAILNRLN